MSDINIFIKLSTLPNALKTEVSDFMDFLISNKLKKDSQQKIHPKAGFLKGTFQMKADFDEPLEDFKEYMK